MDGKGSKHLLIAVADSVNFLFSIEFSEGNEANVLILRVCVCVCLKKINESVK